MQSAENSVRFYGSNPLNAAGDRRVFVKRPMSSYFVVIMGVASQNSTQLPFAQNDEMVDTRAADRSDQLFGESILPGRSRRNRLIPDAYGAHSLFDASAENPIPIADEVTGGLVPGERLRNLTRNPFCCWMPSDVDPDKRPSIQPDNVNA